MESIKTIYGIVQEGQHRGKQLGFPTMNFPLTEQLPEGIYLSKITIDDKTYNALTFIGAAKTFAETTFQAETYVFDFDQDVYGKEVTVELIKKIRDNQKFDSEEALIRQMEEDKKQAEEFFKKI
jgi:riboflavin kinase/FMN adenylyltransferase